MASTIDNRLFASIRDISFTPLDGTSSTQRSQASHRTEQDSWSQKKNIWQAPRVFKYLSDDPGHHGYLSQKKSPAADMSMSHSGASAVRDDTIGAISSKRLQGPSALHTTLPSGRLGSGLISPTRLRNNGTLTQDPNNMMDTHDRPSLFLGSAPDVEPSEFATPKQQQEKRQPSTIRRGLQHFKVEDAEEFVPSYLQDRNQLSDFTYGYDDNNSSHPHTGPYHVGENNSGSYLNTATIRHHAQPIEPIINSNRMHVASRYGPSSTTRYNRPLEYSDMYSNQHAATNSNTATSYEIQANNHSNHGLTYASDLSPYKASNLRPDVASYQPSYTNPASQYSQQHNIEGQNRIEDENFMASRSTRTHPRGQYAGYVNHDAFSMNSTAGPASLHEDYQGMRQHSLQTAHPAEANRSSSRHPGAMSYMASRYSVPPGSGSTISNERGILQYPTSSSLASCGDENCSYLPSLSATVHQEQSYLPNPTSSTHTYAADGLYPTQSDSKDSRSELLEEFRLCHKTRKYELRDIYGHIVEFSGDQNASRFIQTKLEQANSDEKEQVFTELLTNARQLMTDVFGNYVIQKMFEYGNQSQKKALASQMQGNVMKLSMHAYGCRCVQKALEHILTDQQASLIGELVGQVLWVVENQHGNHVIQKAVECVPAEHIQFIVDEHRGHIVRLSKHIYGCRIIQRILEFCAPNTKRMVLEELHCAIPSLIDDQYGNYVIQCIIKKCSPADRHRVVEYVQRELLFYSTHKFASNVVEKAIQFAEDNQRADIIRTLTGPDVQNGNPSPVLHLLKDQYGNYVIQTVLRSIQGPAKKALADEVRHHLSYIGKVSRSKQVSAMNDTLAAVTAGHSPSSVSTGPQTPRTPTSFNIGANIGTPINKTVEVPPPVYTMRESHGNTISLRQLDT